MADNERLGIISWIVLAAVAIIPPTFGTGFTQFEFLKEAILMILSGAALAGWGAAALLGRRIRMTGARITTVLAVFAAFALFAIAWAPAWQPASISASNWLSAAALFLVVTSPVGRPLSFSRVSVAVAIGVLLSGAVGMLDIAGTGLTTVIWDPPGATGAHDAREFAVGYYAVAIPLIAGGIFRTSGLARIVNSAALLIGAIHFGFVADPIFVGIFAGAAIAVVVIMGILQGFSRISLAFGPLGAVLISAAIAAGLSIAGPEPGPSTDATQLPWVGQLTSERNLETGEIRDARFAIPRIEEANSWRARSYVVGVAFDLFREEPVVGHGASGWWSVQTKYPRPDDEYVSRLYERYPAFRAPHNGLALIMVELGGIGLVLFILWLSALIGITVTALAKKAELENWLIEHFALVTACVAGFAIAIFTPALQLASSVSLLFVAAGLLTRESAALNDFRGLSEVWTVNREGRRWDTSFFLGVIPVALGVSLAVLGAAWVATSYYRSWGDLTMLRTKHELALEQYGKANSIMGGDGEVLYNRALAQRRLGRLTDAVDEVNEAATLRPYDVRLMQLLSALHLRERQYGDAAKAARRAVDLWPNYIEGRRALAASLDLQGRLNDAASELLAILELDPPDEVKGTLHKELGEYYEGPLSNPAKAIEHYQKAIPLLKDATLAKALDDKLDELAKAVERERLMREGKPIPKELMPEETKPPSGHEDHGH